MIDIRAVALEAALELHRIADDRSFAPERIIGAAEKFEAFLSGADRSLALAPDAAKLVGDQEQGGGDHPANGGIGFGVG